MPVRHHPRPFARLTAVCAAGALASLALAGRHGVGDAFGEPSFWLLVALTFAIELLPIRLVRPGSVDLVTIASPFPLAILFLYGALPAMLTWLVVAFAADLIGRLRPVKALFNATQYTVSMAAAAATLALAGQTAPVALTAEALPAMLAAAVVFFAINHVIVGTGLALLARVRILPFLRTDFGFLAWTTGFQLALAPLLLGAPGALMALGAVPVLAIFLGGRQAAAAAYRAGHDALTGLPTRATLVGRLRDETGRRASRGTWVALVDLDRFKSINDTLGHHCGDVLLHDAARRMQDVLRSGDLLARIGGDEFAALLTDCDEEQAGTRAARLTASLDAPIVVEDVALHVSASVGLSPADGLDAEDALRHADIALYRAKDQGTAIARFTGDDARPATIDRLGLGRALAEALDAGEISVHFQAKLPIGDHLPPAMEALARWRHPVLGTVSPAEFVAVAEETGLIKRLTAHVLDGALARAAALRAVGVPVRMGVNLSPKSLIDSSLPELIAHVLDRHGLPGDALQLEITESTALANVARSTPVIEALRALGVSLAIDDFGTGYSSLAQLQGLPVEEIKIDRSFVLALDDDPQAEVIVRSIVTLGHSLGVLVTAEGVETRAALERLCTLGCDYTQGFLFGRPSADAIPAAHPLAA